MSNVRWGKGLPSLDEWVHIIDACWAASRGRLSNYNEHMMFLVTNYYVMIRGNALGY
jgi:hypothetical protein